MSPILTSCAPWLAPSKFFSILSSVACSLVPMAGIMPPTVLCGGAALAACADFPPKIRLFSAAMSFLERFHKGSSAV